MSQRLKYSVKFKKKDIPFLLLALIQYQEIIATDDQKFFKVQRMIDHLYIKETDPIQRSKEILEANGFEVKKRGGE